MMAPHPSGMRMPDISLCTTDGRTISTAALGPGPTVIYAYPRIGRLDEPPLVLEWDLIPGARGCTPETCGFRDHHDALRLPTFEAAGQTLLRRISLLVRDGRIEHIWYPVFPPDRHADEVLAR